MEDENNLEETARISLGKKIGVLPEDIEASQHFLKSNSNILRLYANEYSIHLTKEQQTEIAQLSRKTDLLGLKTARLDFLARSLQAKALKAAIQKKELQATPEEIRDIKKQLSEVQSELLRLNKSLTALVQQLENESALE